jgi:hypothetical protein
MMQRIALDTDPREDLVLAFGLRAGDPDHPDPADLPVAETLLLSPSPWAMTRAGDYLLGLGRDLPQARGLPTPAFFDDPQARLDTQRVALQMVQCQVNGGCGPGGLLTRYYCGRGCFPGGTLAQAWDRAYGAAEIAYARALAARIEAERARRGQ